MDDCKSKVVHKLSVCALTALPILEMCWQISISSAGQSDAANLISRTVDRAISCILLIKDGYELDVKGYSRRELQCGALEWIMHAVFRLSSRSSEQF
jgi:hypothetical protein